MASSLLTLPASSSIYNPARNSSGRFGPGDFDCVFPSSALGSSSSRRRRTTRSLLQKHWGGGGAAAHGYHNGFSALRGRHNDMLQFDFKATDLLTRELSPSPRWVIRSKGSVNDRVGTNSATMNNRGKDEKEKLDQSLESDIEASRNGGFLVSNSHEDKPDDGQEFQASEKFSLFQKELQRSRKKGYKLFGVNMTPETIAIAMVYFVQGILGLSRLAVSFFLKDNLHLDPAETAFLTGFSALPWLIKPLYGFISDGVPLFGYRRRSYLVLCGLLGALSWGSLALFVDNKYAAITVILLSSLSVAFADVVVDSIVVERARGETQGTSGSLQSLCWGSLAAGSIVSAYFSGSLVATYGVRFVFGITAILPLITSAVSGLVHEEHTHDHVVSDIAGIDDALKGPIKMGFLDTSRSQLSFLWETVKEPNIFLPTAFIFLWQATPTSDTAMFFFMTNKLGFGPEFLGRVKLVTAVASLVGVGVYNSYLKEVPLRRIFLWTTVLGTGLGLTQVSFMPVLVLAARLCPPGVEATLFATLMSISNGAGVVGGLLGAELTQFLGVTSENFQNLALLLLLCNVSSLFPLPFLGLLPTESELKAAVEKAETALTNTEEMKDE
ncbi:hypothetical protein CY35_01G064300 [Sphagnum magellanicum]|nr:hypothetical protein CY35_01G064300 [Sphagnum magellanicum]